MTDLKKYQPSAEQLEVGKMYEASDDGDEWELMKYDRVSRFGNYEDEDTVFWRYIRECQTPLGKIKPKPVELVDGEYYLFDTRTELDLCGRYQCGYFQTGGGTAEHREACTNIRRLKVVEDH